MRLIRRRTKAAHPSDVLESISILLAECRNPSTQKNIIACAADTLRKTLPADSLLLIAYPAVKGMVEILFSQGKWAGLTPDSIQPCEDWQEAEAAERIHDALLRIENPLLGIWHTPLHFRRIFRLKKGGSRK